MGRGRGPMESRGEKRGSWEVTEHRKSKCIYMYENIARKPGVGGARL